MTSHPAGERSNPETCGGSLIWWVHVPTSEQNYLQAILEGYDDLGYYQTFPWFEKDERGESTSLARLTSSIDAQVEAKALLDVFRQEINLKIPDSAPSFGPSEQPKP